jgi:hypothetical protein
MRRALSLTAVVLCALARPARAAEVAAPPSLTVEQMTALMHTYVEGEQAAAIPFAGTGVVTLAAGGLLLKDGGTLERGAAWPLLGVGAIETAAGVVLLARGGAHRDKLDKLLAEDPQRFATEERHHLHLIRDRYQPILLIAEAAITAGGGALAIAGARQNQPTMEGVGLGLAVQGTAMFLLDWAVLDRARPYATALAQFMPEPAQP